MAEFFTEVTEAQQKFIAAQHMFFVATAASEGRISLSPKGLDTFRCLTPNLVGYLDLVGSGNETAAYLKADGRITFMFCAFQGRPLILRLYGKGRSVQPHSPDWPELAAQFSDMAGARQIILADIDSVQTSCGYAVPEYELKQDRKVLSDWLDSKSADGLQAYQQEKNRVSIDGFDTGLFPKDAN